MDNDIEEVAPQTQRKKIKFKQIPGISPIKKCYEIKFIKGHPSDFRRCLTCKKEIKCSKLIFEETAYLRENDLESEPGFDEPSDIADLIDDTDDYVSVVKTAAAICRTIHRSVRLQEKLQDAQKIKGLPQVSVVIANVTRWNSILKMLERFVSLKFPLIHMFENEKDDFDWLKLTRIMDILAPLRNASLDLQKGKVGPKNAVDVLSFLNQLAGTESAVTSAIRPVLEKWLDGNVRRHVFAEASRIPYTYLSISISIN